jgi:hypothetical protein
VIVVLSGRAEREMARVDARWRAERPAAPNLFRDELDELVDVLPSSPNMGKAYGTWHETDVVRRVMLEKTQYHVYYAIDGNSIVILSIWGARRARGPRLAGRTH